MKFEVGKIYESKKVWPMLSTGKFKVIRRTKCYVWTEDLTADFDKINKSWIYPGQVESSAPHGTYRCCHFIEADRTID